MGAAAENSPEPKLRRLIREKDLHKYAPLGKSQRKRLIARKEFPEPIRISERAVAWDEDDIIAWQKARLDAAQQSARKHSKKV
jgi:predicted DNA-binding transcriptional regulator AlpA